MNKFVKKLIFYTMATCMLPSCINDLNTEPIDPNIIQKFDQDAVYIKCYSTLALTGQKGPDGDCDIVADDEGYSAFYRVMWVLNEFPSDEGWWIWNDAGVPDLKNISWNSSNEFVMLLYNRLNFDVTLCNHFLDNATGSDEKTRLQRAEVRFIRALNYYHLLDLFGNVPFSTTVSMDLPKQTTRTELYSWLETELIDIENELAEEKPSLYRVDKNAARLLLARLYLNAEIYTGTAQWDKAAEYAAKVMNSQYKLAPVYKQMFMGDNDKNGSECEFVLTIAQDGIQIQSWGGARFLVNAFRDANMNPSGSSDSWSCFRSSPELIYMFFDETEAPNIKGDENLIPTLAGDDRAMFCQSVDSTGFSCNLLGNQSATFNDCWAICKWTAIHASGEVGSDPAFPDTDIPLMRVAEAYLTYAEAVFRGGAAVNGTAEAAIQALRDRANNKEPFTLSEDFLLDEWAREFYCEGRRRSDLIRFGQFAGPNVTRTWEGRGGANSGDAVKELDEKYNLYPIPYSDITANSNLKQNPGY